MSKWLKFGFVMLFCCRALGLAAETDDPPGFWHPILPGETITTIAAKYDINPHLLAGVNDIRDWNYILAGGYLWVPPGYARNVSTYVVQENDYLLKIAQSSGVSVWTIARANGIFNLDVIYPGQVLIIPAD